jgi:hypothetical protein
MPPTNLRSPPTGLMIGDRVTPSSILYRVWLWMAAVRADLREIVRSVMRSFVPEIAGLPSGGELDTPAPRPGRVGAFAWRRAHAEWGLGSERILILVG